MWPTLFALAATVWVGTTFRADAASASAQSAYRIQLEELSVHATRARRTDTNYASVTVQVGNATPRTVTRRLGDMGRGVKAIGIAFPRLTIPRKERLKIVWAVVNYGGERHDLVLHTMKNGTEQKIRQENGGAWLSGLAQEMSEVLASRSSTCDGPVLADFYEASGADLSRHVGDRKALRISKRQAGIDAPRRCGVRSDYSATVAISRIGTR
jgi:hypothetical protein